jgi:hypothetical protein
MSFIPESEQEYLRKLFAERLEGNVHLHLYTRDPAAQVAPGKGCITCQETQQLLEELTSLSDKLKLDVHDVSIDEEEARSAGIEELPTIVFKGRNQGTLRFVGIPAGYESSTLVEDVIQVSRGTTELQYHSRQVLAFLTTPIHIKVFVTPT